MGRAQQVKSIARRACAYCPPARGLVDRHSLRFDDQQPGASAPLAGMLPPPAYLPVRAATTYRRFTTSTPTPQPPPTGVRTRGLYGRFPLPQGAIVLSR